METDKIIYELFIKVLNDPNYAEIGGNYKISYDELLRLSTDFSPEQWQALSNYLEALNNIHETMMTIILEGRT